MSQLNEQGETGCCPRFNPEPWDEKEITWEDKLFIKSHVRSFFHIPLNMGGVMTRTMEMVEAADAATPQPLMLSDEKSLWGSDIYIAVTRPVPKAEMAKISGTFLTRVFEGGYSNTGKWVREMAASVKDKGKEMKKLYFFYTTCPKCAKAYGENYTVLLVEI